MISSPANYIPRHIASDYSRQAWRVWAVAVAVVLAWVLATVSAPIFLATGYGQISRRYIISSALFAIRFQNVRCKSRETSLRFVQGVLGFILGYWRGCSLIRLWRLDHGNRAVAENLAFFGACSDSDIDWSLGVFGIWENTHLSRFITGSILGVACATFIVPALVEITRNLNAQRN